MTSLPRVSLLAAAVAVGSFFGTSAQAMTPSAMPAVNNVVKPLQAVGYRRGYYRGGYAGRGYYGGGYARRGYYGPGRRYGYYPYHRRYYGGVYPSYGYGYGGGYPAYAYGGYGYDDDYYDTAYPYAYGYGYPYAYGYGAPVVGLGIGFGGFGWGWGGHHWGGGHWGGWGHHH